MLLSDSQCQSFAHQGYVVFEHALSPKQCQSLHEEADVLLNHAMNEGLDLVRDLGCIIEPLNCAYTDMEMRDCRDNIQRYKEQRDSISDNHVSSLILDIIPRWSAQLLRSDIVYLLNEQYIIKPPSAGTGSSFRWHTDGEYLPADEQHINSVACWTALDEVDQNNGSLTIRPMDGGADMEIKVPAGSIVFISNRVVHKSTPNNSRRFRRVYMPQYSSKRSNVGFRFDISIST
ncbi:hypothetical protein INT43_005576 [Umbelopsis isabellina]|uniref:Phytanoyl-CoA dioxygenase family protein n=1 Tax=Mortierella isabellina TaxID=91625 RepID=A0A8H7PLR8_MORIS|nr:hypothetical protein INT43_005576 [Umbelopsis isabellina]